LKVGKRTSDAVGVESGCADGGSKQAGQESKAERSGDCQDRQVGCVHTTHVQRVGRGRQQGQVGNGRGEAHLEQGLGPSEVARLANAQLHQACDAVLHHLSAPACLGERRSALQFARLLEQRFVRMQVHGSSASTPRALGLQRARRTRVGGKHERAAAIF
jgi:hypothetical protein